MTRKIRNTGRSIDVSRQLPALESMLAFRHRVLEQGRRLLVSDEIAHADFVERTISRYCDFAIDEARFFEEYDRALIEEYCHGSD